MFTFMGASASQFGEGGACNCRERERERGTCGKKEKQRQPERRPSTPARKRSKKGAHSRVQIRAVHRALNQRASKEADVWSRERPGSSPPLNTLVPSCSPHECSNCAGACWLRASELSLPRAPARPLLNRSRNLACISAKKCLRVAEGSLHRRGGVPTPTCPVQKLSNEARVEFTAQV